MEVMFELQMKAAPTAPTSPSSKNEKKDTAELKSGVEDSFVTIYTGPGTSFHKEGLMEFSEYDFRVRIAGGQFSEKRNVRTAPALCWDMHYSKLGKVEIQHSFYGLGASIQKSSDKWKTIIANRGNSSGTFSWELRIDIMSKGYIFLGVASRSADPDLFVGGDLNGWGFFCYDRSLYHNRNKSRMAAKFDNFGNGDIIKFTLDSDAGTLSLAKNSGKPFVAFANLPVRTELFPAVSLLHKGDTVTICDNFSFNQIPPCTSESYLHLSKLMHSDESMLMKYRNVSDFCQSILGGQGFTRTLIDRGHCAVTSWLSKSTSNYRSSGGKLVEADISELCGSLFGFYPCQHVMTDSGKGVVLGVEVMQKTLAISISGKDMLIFKSIDKAGDVVPLGDAEDLMKAHVEVFTERKELLSLDLKDFNVLVSHKDIRVDAMLVNLVNGMASSRSLSPFGLSWFDIGMAFLQHNWISRFESMNVQMTLKHFLARFSVLRCFNSYIDQLKGVFELQKNIVETWKRTSKFRQLKHLIFLDLKLSFLEDVIRSTITYTRPAEDPYEDPPDLKKITLNRHKAGKAKNHSSPEIRCRNLLFPQTLAALNHLPAYELRRAFVHMLDDGQPRTFKVKFVGEGVQDNGGPYRELFNDLVAELFNEQSLLPLFIRSPNNRETQGLHQDKWIVNPSCFNLEMFEFFGKIIGVAVRHKIQLNMNLSPLFWKYLLGETIDLNDLEAIDFSICKQIKEIKNFGNSASFVGLSDEELSDYFVETYDSTFTCVLSDGVTQKELLPNGSSLKLNMMNRHEWARLVVQKRIFESREQMDAILRGLQTVIPMAAFRLFTPEQLEIVFCGSPDFSVQLLQEMTVYEGNVSDKDKHIQFFWSVLGSLSPMEKSDFVRFVWARSRLPATASQFGTKFKIQEPRSQTWKNPDSHLPQSHTCFFSLSIPAYTSAEILKEKLLYACANCATMDLDMKLQDDELYNYEANDLQ
eukprot:TRINITY_DN11357_c0_g1_i1.p1 TRINITY_DN11357_c0_g1~~TRINITY_DN11357_c0_g1_i1.p1  ORF type:complete len:1001 (+),score=216.22 TRINITY_DN11357_c0_g1_i1:70-3003(+)